MEANSYANNGVQIMEYEEYHSIEYDGSRFVVRVVDRETAEWEANTGNELLDSYINSDLNRFDYYDQLVQDAIKKGKRNE